MQNIQQAQVAGRRGTGRGMTPPRGFWDFGILGFWDFGILGFWEISRVSHCGG
jgi:hypothetical protein